ncbi:MAG: type II toxin-antitoxin system VapC family toxin [Chloroflexi bacterium]|nr:type II toxin-antitoxin system VapC family toxin [Chloroflexota bacterium]
MADGLLDTNIFIHAPTSDSHSEECRRFLAALEAGTVRAVLETLVLHELSYALPHYLKQLTRADVAIYLLTVLSWRGGLGEKDLMADSVQRWAQTPGLSFADAYLAALAAMRGSPVFTRNRHELAAQGVDVPSRLPHGA